MRIFPWSHIGKSSTIEISELTAWPPAGKYIPWRKRVTLTAALAYDPSVGKSFIKVPRLSMDAYLADDGVTMDGVMDENSWVLSRQRGFSVTDGNVSGTASVLWDTGCVYVGLEYENADALSLTLGYHWKDDRHIMIYSGLHNRFTPDGKLVTFDSWHNGRREILLFPFDKETILQKTEVIS